MGDAQPYAGWRDNRDDATFLSSHDEWVEQCVQVILNYPLTEESVTTIVEMAITRGRMEQLDRDMVRTNRRYRG